MKESEKKRFRELTDRYELTKDDFWFSPQGWAIISRRGIEKIQTKMGLTINYEIEPHMSCIEQSLVCIKAIATGDGIYIETYGESNPKNTKGGANAYPIAMAEKRALSRAVLKASEFYQLEVMGEDEASGNEHSVSHEPTKGLQRMAESPANRTK